MTSLHLMCVFMYKVLLLVVLNQIKNSLRMAEDGLVVVMATVKMLSLKHSWYDDHRRLRWMYRFIFTVLCFHVFCDALLDCLVEFEGFVIDCKSCYLM